MGREGVERRKERGKEEGSGCAGQNHVFQMQREVKGSRERTWSNSHHLPQAGPNIVSLFWEEKKKRLAKSLLDVKCLPKFKKMKEL